MRLALHTVICCCVFTAVLPLVEGATGEINSSLKKRFKVWLQSRMRRDLGSSLANEHCADVHVGPLQDEDAKTASPPSSFGLNSRARRSTSPKATGCLFVTCVFHDLIHRLHKINNDQKETNAPKNKISSKGYGRRRRRSLPDAAQPAVQEGGQSSEAGQRVRRRKSTCTLA